MLSPHYRTRALKQGGGRARFPLWKENPRELWLGIICGLSVGIITENYEREREVKGTLCKKGRGTRTDPHYIISYQRQFSCFYPFLTHPTTLLIQTLDISTLFCVNNISNHLCVKTKEILYISEQNLTQQITVFNLKS